MHGNVKLGGDTGVKPLEWGWGDQKTKVEKSGEGEGRVSSFELEPRLNRGY